MDARTALNEYKQKGDRVDEVLFHIVNDEIVRLREALELILEDEAPNCDGYETFIHATARIALQQK